MKSRIQSIALTVLGVGMVLLLAWTFLAGREQQRLYGDSIGPPVQKPWSELFPGVPDSYYPPVDGPVWLGPYRFEFPFWDGKSGQGSMAFQMTVDGDDVQFLDPNAVYVPPEGVWLMYVTIAYRKPMPGYSDVRLTFDRTVEPAFTIDRSPNKSAGDIRLPAVRYGNKIPVLFSCTGDWHELQALSAARSIAEVKIERQAASCTAFIGFRPGIRVMISFPAHKLSVAARPVFNAIAMIDQLIVEK